VLDAADKDPELKAALEAAAAETAAQSGGPPSAPVLAETQADVSATNEKVPVAGSTDSQSLVEKKKKASSGASAGVDVERSQKRAAGLRKSLEKIQNNIEASNKALAAHQKHVQELETMIGTQPDGPAKEEL